MSDAPLLGYASRPSFLHSLTGTSKLLLTACLLAGSIISFDTRFLALEFLVSLLLFLFSGMRLRDFSLILWLLAIFMLLNNLLIFLFAPGYGSELYGSRHLLLAGPGGWDITSEQLFYQLNVTLKYFAVMPPVVLVISVSLGTAVAAEASLSFLGLGAKPPAASWGSMLSAAASNMQLAPYLVWPPGVMIFVSVLAFTYLGDGLRRSMLRSRSGNDA